MFVTSVINLKLNSKFISYDKGDENIEGGLQKFLDTQKGGSENIFGLGGGLWKFCLLQNKQEGVELS